MPETIPADEAEPVDDSPGAAYPGGPDLADDRETHESAWPDLLRSLADEYGCDLYQAGPGRYMIRKGATADELDRDRPIRP